MLSNMSRFKKGTYYALLIFFTTLFGSCIAPMPCGCIEPKLDETAWVNNPPPDGEFIYATGVSSSRMRQIACSSSKVSAQTELSMKSHQYTGRFSKFFAEHVPSDDTEFMAYFEAALIEYSSDGELRNVEVDKSHIETTNSGEFICAQLLRMPSSELIDKLERHLQKDEVNYTKFRSSSFYDDFRSLLDG